VLRKFSESGESREFGECRLDHFVHKKYVICAKNDLSYHAGLRQHLSIPIPISVKMAQTETLPNTSTEILAEINTETNNFHSLEYSSEVMLG
jgi:hypothetical protein